MKEERKTGSLRMVYGFMSAYPLRSALMLLCLLFAGFSEGIGIATLLPVVNLAVGGSELENSSLGRIMGALFASAGVPPRLDVLLLVVVLGILLKSGFRLLAMKQVGYTVAYVVTDLRLALVRALMSARWDYFISRPLGTFTNAMSTEAIRLSMGYRFACLMLAEIIEALFYIMIALFISWKVTAASVVVGGIITLSLYPIVKRARLAGLRETGAFQSLLIRLSDLLKGIKPIKAMAVEGKLSHLLESESKSLKKALQQQVLTSEVLQTLQEPIIVAVMAIGLYQAIVHWQVPMTNLLVMAFLFHRSVWVIGKVQKQFQSLAVSESAYWSFHRTLKEADSAKESCSGKEWPSLNREAAFRDVTFCYDGKEVLSHASLSLPHGKLVVIKGPSGAGKTTIVDLLSGLIRPQSGDILLDGVPLEEVNLLAWRQMIGYVPQEMFLFHDSVFNNVTLGDSGLTRADVEEALKKAGALEFVSSLAKGMDTILGEGGGKISGGQRQRIALARALIRKPKLLILDEVTTALDPKTEAAVCKTMIDLRGEMVILAVSHQTAVLEAADVVYTIQGGKAVEEERAWNNRAAMISAIPGE